MCPNWFFLCFVFVIGLFDWSITQKRNAPHNLDTPKVRRLLDRAFFLWSRYSEATNTYLWTNIRCHVWCYWEQQFGEPMGTCLVHHWLVSETVVVDKKNTSVGVGIWFFCNTHMFWVFGKKNRMKRTIGSGYLKIFGIKRITGLGYLKTKIKITEAPVLGISKTSKNRWVSWKNRKRPSSFRWMFDLFLKIENFGYI